MAYLPLKSDVIDDAEQFSEASLSVDSSLSAARRGEMIVLLTTNIPIYIMFTFYN